MLPEDCSVECLAQAHLIRMLDPQHELLRFADPNANKEVRQEFLDRFAPVNTLDASSCTPAALALYWRIVRAYRGYLIALRQAVGDVHQHNL